MTISKEYKHEYISCLPESIETEIMNAICKEISTLLLTDSEKQEAIENANCSKVCDLEDTIQIIYI